MLELSSDMTIEQIAQKFNVSRQRAHQILKRWSDLRPVRIQAAEVRRTPVSVRRTRVIKDTVVSFRLSSPQIDRINEVLRTLELPRRVSRSQACRLFLLAAIGFTPVTLVVPHVQSDVALAATHGRDDQHIEFKNGGMH